MATMESEMIVKVKVHPPTWSSHDNPLAYCACKVVQMVLSVCSRRIAALFRCRESISRFECCKETHVYSRGRWNTYNTLLKEATACVQFIFSCTHVASCCSFVYVCMRAQSVGCGYSYRPDLWRVRSRWRSCNNFAACMCSSSAVVWLLQRCAVISCTPGEVQDLSMVRAEICWMKPLINIASYPLPLLCSLFI